MSVQKEHKPQIMYSCYYARSRRGEQFIPEHVFSYQVSGTLTLNDGNKVYTFNEGDFRFCRRNHLVKFLKQPPPGGGMCYGIHFPGPGNLAQLRH